MKCAKCDKRFSRGTLVDGAWLCFTCATENAPVKIAKSRTSKRAWKKEMRMEPCFYCGAPPPSTIDHVVPRSKGGANDRYNAVPACARCNNEKADMEPEEWQKVLLDRQGKLMQHSPYDDNPD